jgi:hypothetical protein
LWAAQRVTIERPTPPGHRAIRHELIRSGKAVFAPARETALCSSRSNCQHHRARTSMLRPKAGWAQQQTDFLNPGNQRLRSQPAGSVGTAAGARVDR